MRDRPSSSYRPNIEHRTPHGGQYHRPRLPPVVDREKRVQPQPMGDKCNPLCPLFTCMRNALFVTNRPVKGRLVRVVLCRLTGEECINGECQYASCRVNALLPNGTCAKALEKKQQRPSDEEMFREMMKVEEYDTSEFR